MILKLTGAAIVPLLWAAGLGSASAQGAARTPRTFNSTVTHTGPAGNSLTRQSRLTTNGQGGFTSNSTWTGPKGQDGHRAAERVSTTPPPRPIRAPVPSPGPTASSPRSTRPCKVTATAATTVPRRSPGPNGNTVTTTGQGQYNAATGTFNQSRTTTYPNGQSSTESRSVSVAPTQPQGN